MKKGWSSGRERAGDRIWMLLIFAVIWGFPRDGFFAKVSPIMAVMFLAGLVVSILIVPVANAPPSSKVSPDAGP